MSYDIYCYQSDLGYPDVDEATRLTSDEDEEIVIDDHVAKIDEIAKALADYNPDFNRFQFDYTQIAVLHCITVEEAQRQFRHAELNTSEGALVTQIQIMGSSALITIPYWYTGKSAAMVFEKVNQYLKIIRKEAGYLVFDPQTGKHMIQKKKILMACSYILRQQNTLTNIRNRRNYRLLMDQRKAATLNQNLGGNFGSSCLVKTHNRP